MSVFGKIPYYGYKHIRLNYQRISVNKFPFIISVPQKRIHISWYSSSTTDRSLSLNEIKDNVTSKLSKMKKDITLLNGVCDWNTLRKELDEINTRLEDASLWEKSSTSQLKRPDNSTITVDYNDPVALQKRQTELNSKITEFDDIKNTFTEMDELANIADEEQDLLLDIDNSLESNSVKVKNLTLKTAMNDPNDSLGCFIELRAGSGGTESCDWVQIIKKMYTNWANNKGYKISVLDEVPDEVAGYKSVSLNISGGEYAYGWLKYESGTHRFIRRSPFDSNDRRHTSFISVKVSPDLGNDSTAEIDLPARDLHFEVTKSQGAGGQHVNTTESAVRVTHLPTGISVLCQQERSQHQNKALAMIWLKAKLVSRQKEQEAKEKAEEHAKQVPSTWGSQIRTYTIHPQQMVKDTRTGYVSLKSDSVLDGNIDGFLECALMEVNSFQKDNQ